MTKRKKISLLFCSLAMLFAGLFFVGCGGIDYSSVSISCDRQSFSMEVDETVNLTFTINNFQSGMSNEIYIGQSGKSVSYQIVSVEDNQTVVAVTGMEGGQTTLTATCEGQKEVSISINVLARSSSFENGDNSLYVTETRAMTPTSADFKFDTEAGLREVEFYFYGKANGQSLTLTDIQDDSGNFVNRFVSASLISQDGQNHLIFTDENGNLFSIGDFVDGENEVFVPFIDVSLVNGEYVFEQGETPYDVQMGDDFTFVAYYASAPESALFAQRDFYVFANIDTESISTTYYYETNDGIRVDIEDQSQILLVPNAEKALDLTSVIRYNKAIMEVSLPSSSTALDVDFTFDDPSYFNKVEILPVEEGDRLVYRVEITSNSDLAIESNLNIRIFYSAIADVTDSEVSHTITIPLSKKYQPSSISVNNESGTQSQTIYSFYTQYSNNFAGWQPLNLNITPIDAEYENIQISFNPRQVNLRYNGVIYNIDDLVEGEENVVLTIEDATLPLALEMRGLRENGEVTPDGTTANVNVSVNYNLIDEGEVNYAIRYTVRRGASNLDVTDDAYSSIVYVPYSQNVITFAGLFADASFSSVSYEYVRGDNIVSLSYNSSYDTVQDEQYLVSTDIRTTGVGTGTYRFTLDNGLSRQVTICVVEELDSLSTQLASGNDAVRYLQPLEDGSGSQIYIYNNNYNFNQNVTLNIIANGNPSSTAITQISQSLAGGGFTYDTSFAGMVTIDLTTTGNGNGVLTLILQSQSVENFKPVTQETRYTLNITSYSSISGLRLTKRADGQAGDEGYDEGTSASYVYLYTGTDRAQATTAVLDIELRNSTNSGYLFRNPVTDLYENATFSREYVYWRVPGATLTQNGRVVSEMVYLPNGNNLYRISNYATFDTETMTITSLSNAAQFTLVAYVDQYSFTYSVQSNVIINNYIPVSSLSITSQELDNNSLSFSRYKFYKEIVVHLAGSDATNKEIQVSFTPGRVTGIDGEQTYVYIFGENNQGIYVQQIGNDGLTYLITLDSSEFNPPELKDSSESLSGSLQIVATDWLDDVGNVKDEYRTSAITVDINYQNGTEKNPYVLETAQDVLNMKDSLASWYYLGTSIDMSAYSSSLPLGVFTGHLIGNDQARITGLNISNSASVTNAGGLENGNYFGLFTYVEAGASIENVDFVGHFEIENISSTSSIGLIAGANKGTITNVGIEMDANSTIALSDSFNGSLYFGALTGQNLGMIAQDFTVTINTYGNSVSPKITVYAGDYLTTISANGLSSQASIYAGGLVGTLGATGASQGSTGTISKTANPDLTLLGYGNYMSYNNITLDIGTNVGTTQHTNNYLGGLVGYIYGGATLTSNGTSADSSIIVGGEMNGVANVGGVVGTIVSGATMYGLTSRTFVRGYANVGAISASTAAGVTGISAQFYVQAVDTGVKAGTDASMIILYSGEAIKEIKDNNIAFGSSEHGLNIFNDTHPLNTYITREHITIADSNNDDPVGVEDQQSYYGDFIVLATDGDGQKIVKSQEFFTLDSATLYVSANTDDGFAQFTDGKNFSSSIFYMFYFRASSLSYASDNEQEDLAGVQAQLDSLFNRVSSSSSLYPVVASSGTVLRSQNSDVLSIDQNGRIQVNGIGRAVVTSSSVLNANETTQIVIYVVNYFNHSRDLSVIYPSYSTTDDPLVDGSEGQGSVIDFTGNQTVYEYVRPNYSKGNMTVAGIETDDFEISADGVMLINNVSVRLEQNTSVTASVTAGGDGAGELRIRVNGQTISISRGSVNEDSTFTLSFSPRLEVTENGTYYAPVNNQIDGVELNYKRGAESINVGGFDSVNFTTGDTVKETVYINSTMEEDKPYYQITRGGEVIQGTFVNGQEVEDTFSDTKLFNISFGTSSSGELTNQAIPFTLSVDQSSDTYLDRYNQNIYGEYTLTIYASSDTSKHVDILLKYENVGVNAIIVDNYSDFAQIQTNKNLGASSDYAHPGVYGLMTITIDPDTADFDYITISNTSLAQVAGNGSALFSVVARKTSISEVNENLFNVTSIQGSTMGSSLTITLDDIIEAYSGDVYENFHGVIYIRYIIGTEGAIDGGQAQFQVAAYKNGQVTGTPRTKTLTLSIQDNVNISLDGKTEASDGNYYVARGLRYLLNIESYGYSSNQITIASQNPDIASVVIENGRYYIQLTSSALDYSEGDVTLDITATATKREGDIERTVTDTIRLNVLNFVFNYNISENANADIVTGMANGSINVQIGNKITFSIDLSDYLEYDSTNSAVVSRVQNFMNSLAKEGEWEYYTNLNESGVSSGQTITTSTATSRGALSGTISNIYFTSTDRTVQPLVTHQAGTNFYLFSYTGYFRIQNGGYVYYTRPTEGEDTRPESNKIYTEFALNVYLSSSRQHPIPINTYEELMNMYPNSYYILMNDLVLDNKTFQPINVSFASFDGNGHTIRFVGDYNFGSSSQIGLFASIPDGGIVKNLTVTIAGGTVDQSLGRATVTFRTTSSSFNIGLIAGENLGAISNCYVYSEAVTNSPYTNFLTVSTASLEDIGYVAGIAGTNTGSITNSRSALYAISSYNLAGVVGTNSGIIASTYFKNGVLIGNSRTQNLAGFAIENTSDAQILTSYVSGTNNSTMVYSDDTEHYLLSTTEEAGFVYNNEGTITDCYTNINIQGSSQMAGFVFSNSGGTIRNSFSTSILQDSVTSSAGFAMDDTEGDNGTFENCYYLADSDPDNDKDTPDGINTALRPLTISGIEALEVDTRKEGEIVEAYGFDALEEKFADYVYSNTPLVTTSVWFYSTGVTSSTFDNTIFSNGRLELVSANIIAFSQQEFLSSETDSSTGDVTYTYRYTSDAYGSIKNPRLVYDAQSMEDEIVGSASASNVNNQNIRIVDTIDYTGFTGLSSTYRITLTGTVEGNGMTIRGNTLVSGENLTSAGMFAQIGRSATQVGTVMNLNLQPNNVTFNSTNSVGGLAGIARYANIYNVSITSENNLTINGNNFVGGLIGRAELRYDFKNLSSSVNAVANYKPTTDLTFTDNGGSANEVSYAGGVVGYLGRGNANELYSNNVQNVMGDKAGFVVGVVGGSANVSRVYSSVSSSATIKAYRYGGMVAGESNGNMSEVSVTGSDVSSVSVFSLDFSIPTAVGGIAGSAKGGRIEQVYMGLAFSVGSVVTGSASTTQTVNYVGGLVGLVGSNSLIISQAVVEGDISASGSRLGGAIGRSENATSVTLDQIAIKSSSLAVGGADAGAGEYNSSVYVGGLIGQSGGYVEINNSYVLANITANIYHYRIEMHAYVGGFVGGYAAVPTMSYSYCTSSFNVTMQNMGASGSAVTDFGSWKGANSNGGEVAMAYNQNDKNTTEVYYFGRSLEDGTVTADDYANVSNYASFNVKANPTDIIGLQVNNLGQSTVDLANELSYSPVTDASVLNNIFMYKPFIDADQDGEKDEDETSLTYMSRFNGVEAYIVGNDPDTATELYAMYNGDDPQYAEYRGQIIKYKKVGDEWNIANPVEILPSLSYERSDIWVLVWGSGAPAHLQFEDNLYWL